MADAEGVYAPGPAFPAQAEDVAQGQPEPSPPPPPTAPPPPAPPNVGGGVGGGAGAGQGQNFEAVRDRLFYAIFVKAALSYARYIPPNLRRLLEFFFLLKALALLALLVYVHVVFNRSPATCLQHVKEIWPRDGVLRLEVLRRAEMGLPLLADSALQDWADDGSHCVRDPLRDRFRRLLRLPRGALGVESAANLVAHNPQSHRHRHQHRSEEESLEISAGDERPADSDGHGNGDQLLVEEAYYVEEGNEVYYYQHLLEYSLHFGFLRLDQRIREKHNVEVLTVRLDPDKDVCFGRGLTRILLADVLGYDDLLMASVKALAENMTNKGYLRNCLTGDTYRFVSSWMGQGSYVAAFAVMLVFTFSISMLLRFSHHQIFVFIIDLLQMFELNQAIAFPAAPLLTVILALVGMEAIMSEFFADSSTAFYVILMVWVGDQYDAVCCNAPISKRHWLRFFFLYQWGFYAYHYRFNGQYSGLALLTNWLFLQHSMLFFFHHYELPLILHQQRVQRVLHNLHSDPRVTQASQRAAPPQPQPSPSSPPPPPPPRRESVGQSETETRREEEGIRAFADEVGRSVLSEALEEVASPESPESPNLSPSAPSLHNVQSLSPPTSPHQSL